MGGNYYQNKYSRNKGNGSKKKKTISNEAMTLLTLAAVGTVALGAEGLNSFNNNRIDTYEVRAEETIKPNAINIEEKQEEILRDNAKEYTVNEFYNKISHMPNEKMYEFREEIDGKYIEMTGEVLNVRANNCLDYDHISMSNTCPDNLVALYGGATFDFYDENEKSKLSNIETGDVVTIIGKYDASEIVDTFVDCEIVSYVKGDGSFDVDYSKIEAAYKQR